MRAAGEHGKSCHDDSCCSIFKLSDYRNLGRCLKALCAEQSSLKEQIPFAFLWEQNVTIVWEDRTAITGKEVSKGRKEANAALGKEEMGGSSSSKLRMKHEVSPNLLGEGV